MSTDRIRILLVDDHGVVRNGIRLMLGVAEDIEVAGEAATAQDALQFAHKNGVARVLEKMGVKNNAELTRYAIEHGLLG